MLIQAIRCGIGHVHHTSVLLSHSLLTYSLIRAQHAYSQDRRVPPVCCFSIRQRAMCVAQHLHDGFAHPKEQNLNSVFTGLIKGGKPQHALMVFQKMQQDEFLRLSGPTVVHLLKACARLKDLESGLRIHAEVDKSGLLQADLFVGNTLIDMYAKCGSLIRAQQVFDDLSARDVVTWTALIAGYVEHGCGEQALDCFERMQHDDVSPNSVTYVFSLKACGIIGALEKGQEIHAEIQRKGFGEKELAVGNTLINMYIKFGLQAKAKEVFDCLPARNVVSWTSLIAGYTEQGHEEEALKCFENMQHEGVSPDAFTFACALKACGSLGVIEKGEKIQVEAERRGLIHRDLFIGNTLVDMYAKCGRPAKAQEVFDKLPNRDVVSWTALVSGYVESGFGEEALQCFEQMQLEGSFPNNATLICSLKACGSLAASAKGRGFHAKLESMGLRKGDLVLANSLVDMYAKCGLLANAQEAFDKAQGQDMLLWTTLITGCVEHGNSEKALVCFEKMQLQGITVDVVTYVCILKACGSLGAIDKGRELHTELERKGFATGEIVVGNVLVDMYAKCRKLEEAQVVFDRISSPNVVTWNALITGYVEHDYSNEALKFLEKMQEEGVSPNALTYVCSLKACCNIGCTERGRGLHGEIEKKGFLEEEDIVGNALIDMYAKCGSVVESQQVFDRLQSRDVVSWNSLIGGYAEHGHNQEALKLVEQMRADDITPNSVTYLCSLKACASLGALHKGQKLHAEIEKIGILDRDPMVGSALVDMYAKCGLLAKSVIVFSDVPVTNVVSWTALIAGYVEQGCGEKALHHFEQMQLEGISPNAATFVCSLKACCSIGAVEKGIDIHAEIERRGFLDRNLVVGNMLVDVYAKLGLLVRAQAVFDKLPVRNVVSWTSLIAGYTEHGEEEEAIRCLEQMKIEGTSPDSLTIVSSLRACGSVGATSKGQEIHADIERKGMWAEASVACIALVDMYAKCGSLALAQQIFDKLPVRDAAMWNALIGGYLEHGYIEEALNCFEKMQFEGVTPNTTSFVCSLKACGTVGALEKGWELHAALDRKGLISSDRIGNTLLDMYAKCGAFSKALDVFDNLPEQDTVSWTALIARHVEHGHNEEALRCFEHMQSDGVFPDPITYVCVLKACGSAGAIDKGRELHLEIECKGCLETNGVVGNTLVSMYAVCGSIVEAQCVFEKLLVRDVVSWNALITGYVEAGEIEAAFCSFDRMLGENIKPDPVTFLVLLNACKCAGLFDKSQMFCEVMSKTYGLVPTNKHLTSVVDLLCCAGHVDTALAMIKRMPSCPNLVVWRMVLNVCKNWGNIKLGKEAFKHTLPLNDRGSASYVLMSHIYAGSDMCEYTGNGSPNVGSTKAPNSEFVPSCFVTEQMVSQGCYG